ncbi:hypothetical protein Tco_0569359 [Tanacetum coccineum]
MISSRISISLAIRNPARSASYSASLLVVLNPNLNAYVYSFPSGLTTIRPTPEPSELEALSVNSFHAFLGSGSFLLTFSFFASLFSGAGVSTRKSANICPLVEFLTLNSISCSPNSIAHLAMRLDFSGFARICFIGNRGFDTYVWYLTSCRIPTSINSSTKLWITSFLSGARIIFFCFIGSAWLNTFIRCSVLKVSSLIINILGTSVMWVEVHAKTSMYFFKRSRILIFILVGNYLPIIIIYSMYLSFITTISSVSMQLRMISSFPWYLLVEPPSSSFGFCELYSEKMVPIPLGVWNFMAPWTVDTTIPICCIEVLPSSKLCGESDFTITDVSVFVTTMGPSPIVISKGISPNGHHYSPKKLMRGVFESTRRDLIDGFSFKKQCLYITSYELPPSRYTLFTCLHDMYALIMTRFVELTLGRDVKVISPILL